jgi:hypothetical protein
VQRAMLPQILDKHFFDFHNYNLPVNDTTTSMARQWISVQSTCVY